MLRAFDADDLRTELWNSNQNGHRDDAGNWPKFSPPTVVNGRVYLGSFPSDGVSDTQVNVYGLLGGCRRRFHHVGDAAESWRQSGQQRRLFDQHGRRSTASPAPFIWTSAACRSVRPRAFSANDVTPPAQTTMTISATCFDAAWRVHADSISGSAGTLDHSVDTGLYVTNAAPGAGTIGIDFVGNAARRSLRSMLAGVTAQSRTGTRPPTRAAADSLCSTNPPSTPARRSTGLPTASTRSASAPIRPTS